MPVAESFIALTDTLGVTNTGSGGRDPQITSLIGGGFVISWAADNVDSSGEAVMMRIYDANGTPLGNEIQVNQTESGEQYAPAILARDDGGFDVFWFYETQGRYVRSFDASGMPLGDEIDLGTGFTPVLTSLSTGNFMEVVTAVSFSNQQGLVSSVRINLLNSSYGQTGTSLTINQTALPDGVVDLAITTLGTGNVVALWSDNSSGAGSGTFGRIISPQGTAVSDEFQVDTYDEGRQIEPRVTALDGGGFVVTWKSGYGQDGSDWGQFAQVFNDDGTKVGGEFQVNTIGEGIQYQGTPVALADGGFVIAYLTSPYETDTDSAILVQRFDATGTKLGDAATVASVDMINGNQFYTEPFATAIDGGFAVTWWGGNTPDTIYTRSFVTRLSGTELGESIDGTNARELIDAGDGADIVSGADGNDTILGGTGADDINGGAGNDLLISGDAIVSTFPGEVVEGTANGEVILGGAWDDVINAAEGNDTIIGQAGADIFIFDDGFGQDVILDFEDGADLFDMGLITGVSSFADITVTQTNTGTELSLMTGATDTALLAGVQATDIDASDFLFV